MEKINNNDSVENIGSDQAQIERDGNESNGRCEDEYNEHEENKFFDIDNQKNNEKAISDGDEDSPGKTTFGDLLMINNATKMDEMRTAKKPARGASIMAGHSQNRLKV